MDDPELSAVLLIFMLMVLGRVLSALEKQNRRLKKMERLLTRVAASTTGLVDEDELEPEVKELVLKGDLYKAMKLYRAFHDVSLREAEVAINRAYAAIRRDESRT